MSEFDDVLPENNHKTPIWQMICQLIGGACLKIYFDVTGLTEMSSKFLIEHKPTSIFNPVANDFLVIVGSFLLGCYLSNLVFVIVDNFDLRSKSRSVVKGLLPLIYFAAVFVIGIPTKMLLSAYSVDSDTSRYSNSLNKGAPVEVTTMVQSSEGVIEANLSLEFLANMESWMVGEMRRKGKKKLLDRGMDPEDYPALLPRSFYVTSGKKKLGVIKINMDNVAQFVIVLGITRAELHRVHCIRRSYHAIPFRFGKCGEVVRKTFNLGNAEIRYFDH